ncbi:MAG TPA: IPT/TIG domain-containing protein, partial [Candidatus Gracilibacteria bacterium]|nr:IPT/TIG domain-containing protein [Candidatus Gracilibacteria bacterium]
EISDTNLNFYEGSDLTSVNGTDLYAVAGTETTADNFWNYDILTDTWTALTGFADIGGGQQTADDGTSIAAYKDQAIYALRGINTDQFYRYDILGDIWEQPATQQFPVNVGSAASQDIADMVMSVLGEGLFAMPGSGSIIYKIDTRERVHPEEVNGGSDPTQFDPFDVVVQSIDLNNNPVTVPANRSITLSLETGTGNLGGNLNGTILSGQSQATISGVTYDTAETDVVLRATDTSSVPTLTFASSDPFTVNPPAPTIISLDVTQGSTAGGTEVTITGTGFIDPVNVTFDGYDADQVIWNSDTEIVATTAAHPTGTIDVQAINPTGQVSNVLSGAYIFADPSLVSINPNAGPTTGGTNVTLSGVNFGPNYYRREISFDNTPSASALTNYEASFTFDTAT